MTVKQLIERLQELPEDYNIHWYGGLVEGDPVFEVKKDYVDADFDLNYYSIDY